jgi:hypothetical protein
MWLHVSTEISYYQVNSPLQKGGCGYFKSVPLNGLEAEKHLGSI